ncbi:hypothetical protein F4780DRAFT_548819 [Xylariomycetidae sp. FL0641]|nr:hypothetical protein F4780DRAFT_548819 [Xylariomycetidae sp. FL0641]
MPDRGRSMTATHGSAFAHDPSAGEVFDPDEVFPRNSPLMKPHRPKLAPSPSPPAGPLPQVSPSPSSSAGRRPSNRREKIRPSQGDAVLIFHLDGGKRPYIAAEAGSRPLMPSNSEDDDESSGNESEGTLGEEDDVRSTDMSPVPNLRFPRSAAESSAPGAIDLQFLATNALAAAAASKTIDADEARRLSNSHQDAQRPKQLEDLPVNGASGNDTGKDERKSVLAAPISPYTMQGSPEMYSPRRHSGLAHPNMISPGYTPGGHGELPPIQVASPRSESSSHEALPSIRSQLADQLEIRKDLPMRHGHQQFPHSPPSRMRGMSGSHASPPVSPDIYHRASQAMPSPANTVPGMSPYYSSNVSANHYRSGPDYSSSSATETPGRDALTPNTPATDKLSVADSIMSIDSMTNPQIGTFVCKFQGCNAQPFQTQYLLNSHANVHSSARPHYCSVKGCPRSEGGKGFKRKNEMIRHGLVHDSPGYVCPFCPDREHKYPRPDNLQR